MAKIAKLVAVSLLTRIIVEETDSEEENLAAAKPQFIRKINTGLEDNVEYIKEDTECPFDPEIDERSETY